jgi:CRISPR-associated protein Csh1
MPEEEGKKYRVEDEIENFFKEYQDTFNVPTKKACFLVGVLVNYLLYVQRDERNVKQGREPFRSKLYGLRLDEEKIKKVFREAVNKLTEYGRTYPSLERIASKYLCESGKWELSKDEISYYFMLGLTLGDIFKGQKENMEGGE